MKSLCRHAAWGWQQREAELAVQEIGDLWMARGTAAHSTTYLMLKIPPVPGQNSDCALTALGSLQEGQPGGQSCCTLIPCTLMNSAPQLVFTC